MLRKKLINTYLKFPSSVYYLIFNLISPAFSVDFQPPFYKYIDRKKNFQLNFFAEATQSGS